MATLKQIEANRLNSQKSTGPRSVEGKAVSSQNALKSGIDAKAHVIRGEKAANLESLTADYHRRFHPTTPEQRMLVDVLIDSEWLLRRFRLVEAHLWEESADDIYKPQDDYILGQAYRQNCTQLVRLQRRIDTALRNYRAALQELRLLQAEAPPEPQPQPEPENHPEPAPKPTPQPQRNQSVKPANGFVSHIQPQQPADPAPAGPGSDAPSTQTGL